MYKHLAKLLEPKTNACEMAILLTSLLEVDVTSSTITREIEQHPDYPSLLSISDVLKNYGIENIGIKFDYYQFGKTPPPFLTQFEGSKGDVIFFTVVRSIEEDVVDFYDPERYQWAKLPKVDFLKRSSRIALLAEAAEISGEKDYKTKRREERRKDLFRGLIVAALPLITVISVLLSLYQYGWGALASTVFVLLTLIGVGVTALLLVYELDHHNPLLQQICSAGKKINCGAVLRSKGAKIFGISWSAIGFTYFIGVLTLLIFQGFQSVSALYAVGWLSLLAVSYSLFSIYYQLRIAKQWCVLCLTVLGILVLQCTVSCINGWPFLSTTGLTVQMGLSIVTAFFLPFIAVTVAVPALQQSKENKQNINEVQKLKHNRQVFNTLLFKQKQLDSAPDGLGILLGNPMAKHRLIKVCNPYCGPCAKAHTPMDDLIENNPDVSIQVIFTASTKQGDEKAPPVRHLLSIAEKNDPAKLKGAMDDWYLADKKDYEAFAKKHPMNGELQRQDEKIDAMREWCNKSGITYTPTFFLRAEDESGRQTYCQLPEIYSVSDLKYFFSI